ncbi:MAG TPA: TAXI family TRAP transporter solute-binding subunit [Casimicrobiaceae bacterium]|nr:TAXI family TRAP transporter solute-binding subunit [Casimicrobiaceae bacterium]
MTFVSRAAIAASVIGLTVAAFAPLTDAQQQNRISITTGGTGGVYYPLGGGMANILSKNVPGMTATAEVTGGSIDNLKLLRAGKSEVALVMADAALEAAQGIDKFKDGKVGAKTLMVLYPNKMHVVTVEGTGIDKLADLKGKRVSTGSAGSGTEVMALRVLEGAGLEKGDIRQERLGVAESVNALKDKKIDAFFWVGGVPTAAVTDLSATPGTKIKLIDHTQVADAMNKKYGPLYVKGTIPANSYAGQAQANGNIDVWNILVATDKMSDQMAYTIVKTLMEKKPELIAVHGEAKNIELKNQTMQLPMPMHPGAKKYFEEQGLKIPN